MSLFTRISVLTLLSIILSSLAAPGNLVSRQAPSGRFDTGYSALPEIEGSTLHQNWEMKGATFPLYLSTATTESDTSAVKRAVIVAPGKLRDCWSHWSLVSAALKQYPEVPYEDVSLMVPCFLTDLDRIGAAVEGNIIFGHTTWVSGHKNIAPDTIDISAYDIMDELVSFYMDTAKFPALEAVVIAGHSAGGQMTQRYAAMRKTSDQDPKVHYWVANPGSLLWLSEDRPAPNPSCAGVDSYKYGLTDMLPAYALDDAKTLGREGLVERYFSRNIHYAWGLADNGPGDTRCQAVTQGATHLERGKNFVAMIDQLGGLPSTSTVDYVAGVSHQVDRMFMSPEGCNKLFKYVGNPPQTPPKTCSARVKKSNNHKRRKSNVI